MIAPTSVGAIYIQKKRKAHPIGWTFLWRRRRDLNPRYPFGVYTISNYEYAPNFSKTQYIVVFYKFFLLQPQYVVLRKNLEKNRIHDYFANQTIHQDLPKVKKILKICGMIDSPKALIVKQLCQLHIKSIIAIAHTILVP